MASTFRAPTVFRPSGPSLTSGARLAWFAIVLGVRRSWFSACRTTCRGSEKPYLSRLFAMTTRWTWLVPS